MAISLSDLEDNLVEGIHEIEYKDCNCFFEYKSVNGNLIKYKCLSCNKTFSNKVNEQLKKKYKFSNNDVNKFILLSRKFSFILKNVWMDRMSSIKQHCQKR